MSEFLFIRHGKTRGNIERRYIGRTDEPLCEPVSRTFELPPEGFKLFVSPMLRCRETAETLFPNICANILSDLRESDFGIFEGKTADELSSCPEYSAWLDSGCMGDIPGGESVTAFRERCCCVFMEIAAVGTSYNVVITHGGVIMSILERFGTPKRGFYDYHLPNGGWLFRRYENGRLEEC